ncbi:FAD-dependent monooxygenase [Actinomadura atramentaria]|uniref:FAD-dependent monooxygenase n=1 Tax=Actinomadura atramentaria TaxID=1990 RepID=UPI000361DA0C|nr:FAD-dependent monooxygenase [Actinomadura atramentaria]
MTDVLIAGAGPTGLLLAGDLARAGVAVTVLERRAETSNLTRAFAVHARTLELLDMRGAADELLRTGTRVAGLRLFGRTAVDLSRLPGRYPFVLVTPQYETERVLRDRALAAGARIETGVEVTGLRQDADEVVLHVRDDGGTGVRRAAYAVGADGVRSAVRSALGLPFPGRSAVRSVMLADVRLRDAPEDVLTFGSTGDAFAFIAPFGDGWYRVIAWNRARQLPDSEPVDVAELRETVRAAHGTDHGIGEPRWTSRFHSDERQVPRYRVGRVLLAGDAAHVHSPAGGQGMNVGLGDAANLGWRLAAVLRGGVPDTLLDGYHAERHPVGRAVLRGSGALLRGALLRPAPLRAARDVLLRAVAAAPPVGDRVARAVSGIGVDYPAPRDAHPLTGRRAPDVPLTGGTRLFEALRDGRFVLAAPEANPVLAALVERDFADRVRHAVADGRTRTTVLVRPDGHIAWAADDPAPATAHDALAAWTGADHPAPARGAG